MKIKSHFYLLVTGIVMLPVLAFSGSTIHRRYFSPFEQYKEEFDEFLIMKGIGLIAPPAFVRFMPFIIIMIIVLFVIAMYLLIIHPITRSILMLENSTRRIANGELDFSVDIKGSDEIVSLTNSLNKMRNALKEEERRRYLFIMGITHDLKTPLSLIKANVEAIEDGIAANIEEQKHSLKIINNKVDELEGMVNNLLDFRRMDSGIVAKNMCTTNFHAFLSSFIERITIDAELLHYKIESNINIPDSLAVQMDTILIQRALDNIVNNFYSYTPKGSSLFIDASLTGYQARLTLSDNGKGIHQKDIPYIFDLFYRGSASRSEQGMGMGLAVTKSIIESHGWSISVMNTEDEVLHTSNNTGACFCIMIPVKKIKTV